MSSQAVIGTTCFSLGLLSIIVLVLVLARLSKEFGEAMKLAPHYYFYYAAAALFVLTIGLRWWEASHGHYGVAMSHIAVFVLDTLSFFAGITASFLASLKYWGWLKGELLGKGSEKSY
ncbi:MAG: hypothetical protein QMD08_07775 [Actinomycetota bacterium]|nr:hypothetical protein [Actinomycetota bacterium]